MKSPNPKQSALCLAAVAMLATAMLTPGCGPEPRDPAVVRAELIQAILKGVDRSGTHLSAEGYNAASHELLNVHVQTSDALFYAQRAVIHVDDDGRYMSIKLFEVLNVNPADEDSSPENAADTNDGRIHTMREFTISNIPTSL
jgi:hypothetical protein